MTSTTAALTAAPSRRKDGSVSDSQSLREQSVVTLVKQIIDETSHLLEKQLELVKAEVKTDVRIEIAAAKRLSIAALAGLCALNMAFVAGALALGAVLPMWLAALVVSGALLIVCVALAALGYQRRVKEPLARTRANVKDDMQWAKERLA